MKIRLEMINGDIIEDDSYFNEHIEYLKDKIKTYGKFVKIKNEYYNSDLIVSIKPIEEEYEWEQ